MMRRRVYPSKVPTQIRVIKIAGFEFDTGTPASNREMKKKGPGTPPRHTGTTRQAPQTGHQLRSGVLSGTFNFNLRGFGSALSTNKKARTFLVALSTFLDQNAPTDIRSNQDLPAAK